MRAPVLFSTLLSLVLLSLGGGGVARAAGTPTVTAEAKPLAPVPQGGIYLGLGGGLAPDSAAGYLMGSLVIDRPLFWRLGLWLSGEWSYLWRAPEPDFTLRLCFGVRLDVWRSESGKVRILTDVAFAHMHEAPTSIWKQYPLETALGESKFGLGHRSGVELGGAVLITPWIDSRNPFARRMRVLARLSGQWMPDGGGPNFFLSLITSVGVAL